MRKAIQFLLVLFIVGVGIRTTVAFVLPHPLPTTALVRTTTVLPVSLSSPDIYTESESLKDVNRGNKKEPQVFCPFPDAPMLMKQITKTETPSSLTDEGAQKTKISKLEASIRKVTMISYIASLCIALPVTLLPVWVLSKTSLVDKAQAEVLSHDVGQTCARWLLKIMPFCQISVLKNRNNDKKAGEEEEEPSIWVCNHTSMLDTFILLATDTYLRGPNKRPIKAIYWKGLEENPVVNLMFKLCGFIPVQMSANGSGNPNEYDKASFISLLRQTKKAFKDGFDILILPEGQLNPWPEQGLLEIFPGAYKLSLISHRPIRFVGLHGFHNLWHPNEDIGMKVTSRSGIVRVYDKFIQNSPQNKHVSAAGTNISSKSRMFESLEEFIYTFRTTVGHFGAHGVDHPDIDEWMDGTAWKQKERNHKETEMEEKNVSHFGNDVGVEAKIRKELEREGRLGFNTMIEQIQDIVTSTSMPMIQPFCDKMCAHIPSVGVHMLCQLSASNGSVDGVISF